MSDAAFLDAICWNPHDLTTRLVYADWLDEQGRAEPAEFIRQDFSISYMLLVNYMPPDAFSRLLPSVPWMHSVGQLVSASSSPLLVWPPRYGVEYGWGGSIGPCRFEWRHSFIAGLRLPWKQFGRIAGALAQRTPLEWIEFTDVVITEHPHHLTYPLPVYLAKLVKCDEREPTYMAHSRKQALDRISRLAIHYARREAGYATGEFDSRTAGPPGEHPGAEEGLPVPGEVRP